eukprot:3353420-Pyramimonas_sp.AAC.1
MTSHAPQKRSQAASYLVSASFTAFSCGSTAAAASGDSGANPAKTNPPPRVRERQFAASEGGFTVTLCHPPLVSTLTSVLLSVVGTGTNRKTKRRNIVQLCCVALSAHAHVFSTRSAMEGVRVQPWRGEEGAHRTSSLQTEPGLGAPPPLASLPSARDPLAPGRPICRIGVQLQSSLFCCKAARPHWNPTSSKRLRASLPYPEGVHNREVPAYKICSRSYARASRRGDDWGRGLHVACCVPPQRCELLQGGCAQFKVMAASVSAVLYTCAVAKPAMISACKLKYTLNIYHTEETHGNPRQRTYLQEPIVWIGSS